ATPSCGTSPGRRVRSRPTTLPARRRDSTPRRALARKEDRTKDEPCGERYARCGRVPFLRAQHTAVHLPARGAGRGRRRTEAAAYGFLLRTAPLEYRARRRSLAAAADRQGAHEPARRARQLSARALAGGSRAADAHEPDDGAVFGDRAASARRSGGARCGARALGRSARAPV